MGPASRRTQRPLARPNPYRPGQSGVMRRVLVLAALEAARATAPDSFVPDRLR